MDRLQLSGAVRVLQVIGMRHVLARIDSGGTDEDSPSISRPPQVALIQDDIVAPRLHRMFVTVFDEVGISMHDSENFDAVPPERGGGRRNHRVGRGRSPPAKRMATRRIARDGLAEFAVDSGEDGMSDSRSFERMKAK